MSDTSIQDFLFDLEPFFDGKSLTFVDVGAHKGKVFSQVVASRLNIREAHLFEPNPDSFAELIKAVEKLKNDHSKCHINSYNVAVGDDEYNVVMKKADTMTKVVNVVGDGKNDHKNVDIDNFSNEFEVSCITLDGYSDRFLDKHVSLLKIDVEGYELEALEGAKKLFEKQSVDVVYIEAGLNPEGTQQTYYRNIEDKLLGCGYRLFKVYEQHNEWVEDSPLLRRMNLAFFSVTFASRFSYKEVMKKARGKTQSKVQKPSVDDKSTAEAKVATKDDVNYLNRRFEDLCWLTRVLKIKGKLPHLEGREMAPGALLELHEAIREAKPRRVVLLGSGASSLVIADALRQNGTGHLIAIDHHEGFVDKSRELLNTEYLSAWAEIIHAPLATIDSSLWEGIPKVDEAKPLKWYETSFFKDIDTLDFLVIDGPPSTTCRFARFPALSLLINRLSSNSQVWVDDALNKEGKEMIQMWCDRFNLISSKDVSSNSMVKLNINK